MDDPIIEPPCLDPEKVWEKDLLGKKVEKTAGMGGIQGESFPGFFDNYSSFQRVPWLKASKDGELTVPVSRLGKSQLTKNLEFGKIKQGIYHFMNLYDEKQLIIL